jgi:hypothetical protein
VADELDRVLALVRSERPGLRLVHKADSPLMRTLGTVLAPLTPDFGSRFTTVLGDTVYLPRPVEALDRGHLARILAHEFVHQLDMAAYGPLFYTSYVLAMPVGRTTRAHWERRAYAVDLMLAHRAGGPAAVERAMAWIVPMFAGPAYGWMWAGTEAATRYLAPVRDEVLAGTLQQRAPYDRILRCF